MPTPAVPPSPTVLQLLIELKDGGRRVWRRVVVPGAFTFADLHALIQAAMPWEDAHLHEFVHAPKMKSRYAQRARELCIGVAGEMDWGVVADEDAIRLEDVLRATGERVRYTYDFGDSWEHDVTVEAVLAGDPGPLPRCVGAFGLAPEEDSRSSGSLRKGKGPGAEQVDASLAAMRRWWKTAAASRLPSRDSPKLLAWMMGDETEACPSCGGSIADAGLLLEVRCGEAPWLAWFDGFACEGCGARLAWLDELAQRADGAGIDFGAIDGFASQGKMIESFVGGSRGGRTAPRLLAWAQVQAAARGPAPDADVAMLPQVAGPWELIVQPTAWVRGKGRAPALAYAMIVTDAEGFVRTSGIVAERAPGVHALVGAIRHAAAAPSPPCEPGRPAHLVIDTRLDGSLGVLAEALGGWGIRVATGPTPVAREASESLHALVDEGIPAWLQGEGDDDVHGFVRAGEALLKARPWKKVAPDTLIRARLGGMDEMFVTLMGNGGTGEVGYVVHETLLDAERARSATSPEEALGEGWEATSRIPLRSLHPADGDRLATLGLLPRDDEILFPTRLAPDGPVRPKLSLRTHALLAEALARGITGRQGETTLETRGTPVGLSWPVSRSDGARTRARGPRRANTKRK